MKGSEAPRQPGGYDQEMRGSDAEAIKLSATEARQAKPVKGMRWVLGLGLGGAAVAMVIAWYLN